MEIQKNRPETGSPARCGQIIIFFLQYCDCGPAPRADGIEMEQAVTGTGEVPLMSESSAGEGISGTGDDMALVVCLIFRPVR